VTSASRPDDCHGVQNATDPFGEHPDTTAERMRGARRVVAHLYGAD
jgi:hypothetical protein